MKKLLLFSILLIFGCKPALHPAHIYFTPTGITLKTTEGDVILDEPGLWMPEWYFEELWDMKVKEVQN